MASPATISDLSRATSQSNWTATELVEGTRGPSHLARESTVASGKVCNPPSERLEGDSRQHPWTSPTLCHSSSFRILGSSQARHRTMLALPLLVAAALAAGLPSSSLAALSTDDVPTLKAELIAWKSSSAGQNAQQQGFIPDGSEEEQLARFANAKAAIEKLQKTQSDAVFSLDTPFALLTADEYADRTLIKSSPVSPLKTTTPPSAAPTNNNTTKSSRSSISLASVSILADSADVDWQRYGCVTTPQHQGLCNGGWAFAAIGSIETNYCIRSSLRKLYELSEQDILTCGTTTSCDNGLAYQAFNWIADLNGGSVCTEASLPYGRADPEPMPCKRVDDPNVWCDKPDLQVASYVQQRFPDHRELEAVVRERSVTAIINPCQAFQYYKGGLLRGDQGACPTPASFVGYNSHDHVLIVGYGTRDGVPYWKVKSSNQGTNWGEQGYAYIERGYQGDVYGAAGIESWIAYPVFRSEVPASFDSSRVVGPRYGVEIQGDTLKTAPLQHYSPHECATMCRREPNCKAYNWVGGNNECVLKSSNWGERRIPITGSSISAAAGVVVSKQEMLSGYCLTPEDNVDYPGNDLYHTLAASTGECCDMCFSMDRCNAYTWTQYHGGSCYLKTQRALKPQDQAPAPDGSAYTRSGVAYKCQSLQFNTDLQGVDFFNLPASGPMDCCGVCRSFTQSCAGYTWTDYNGGTCWLKRSVSGSVSSYGAFSAMV